MKWKEQILNLKAYQPGRSVAQVKEEFQLEHIVKLASNENPFGCSPLVKEWLSQFNESFAIYPDGYATILRKELANHLQLQESQLLFGNGSDEIIQIISRSLLKPGMNTVMATPTFPQYRHNATVEGAEIREIPLKDGAHDLTAMGEAIDENTAIVWLCSPNNPSGIYINERELTGFLNSVPKDVLIVLDEAYHEYVTAEDYYDARDLIKEYPNLLVMRTFSKIYGLASFRIGYAFGSDQLIRFLEPVREPFNVNTIGQGVAAVALKDQSFIEKCRAENKKGLNQFYEFCEKNELHYYPSEGNFILVDFQTNGDDVFQYLMRKGYIVRSGKALGFPTSVRITVGSESENEGVLKAIESFLAEKK
ncbi:histidinol-phosphate aminotransferase [Oikeobacillus pervagus]|uniref:Histidinol-phosphate aminotransferase n=1 Tax=Oikeobacillus pervagus TaxID=1325931 RepID=A0AAJ1WHK0_9BACI|nr:histidinol-phosphate transaminase [Oikeobacillus pervagus]MDQ0213690.1 histidinol-phosphate aminotransferase [Oikeobacillus pervagus]